MKPFVKNSVTAVGAGVAVFVSFAGLGPLMTGLGMIAVGVFLFNRTPPVETTAAFGFAGGNNPPPYVNSDAPDDCCKGAPAPSAPAQQQQGPNVIYMQSVQPPVQPPVVIIQQPAPPPRPWYYMWPSTTQTYYNKPYTHVNSAPAVPKQQPVSSTRVYTHLAPVHTSGVRSNPPEGSRLTSSRSVPISQSQPSSSKGTLKSSVSIPVRHG